MGKLRHISPQGYTIINNDCLRDKELDIEERGLLLTLVSLPDNWNFSITGLCKILPCGKDKINNALQKLEEKDYLRRIYSRSPDGRFDSIDYITCRGCKIGNLPLADFPQTVNPQAVNHKQLNTNKSKINNVLNNNQSIVNECESHNTISDVESPIDMIDRTSQKRDNSLFAERQAYEKLIKENIDYDGFMQDGGYRAELVKAMYAVIIDSVCSTQATLRVNKNEVPQQTVKSVLIKLSSQHIEYVIESIEETKPDMTSVQGYLLTALYNAVSTEGMYYTSKLKADGTIT